MKSEIAKQGQKRRAQRYYEKLKTSEEGRDKLRARVSRRISRNPGLYIEHILHNMTDAELA